MKPFTSRKLATTPEPSATPNTQSMPSKPFSSRVKQTQIPREERATLTSMPKEVEPQKAYDFGKDPAYAGAKLARDVGNVMTDIGATTTGALLGGGVLPVAGKSAGLLTRGLSNLTQAVGQGLGAGGGSYLADAVQYLLGTDDKRPDVKESVGVAAMYSLFPAIKGTIQTAGAGLKYGTAIARGQDPKVIKFIGEQFDDLSREIAKAKAAYKGQTLLPDTEKKIIKDVIKKQWSKELGKINRGIKAFYRNNTQAILAPKQSQQLISQVKSQADDMINKMADGPAKKRFISEYGKFIDDFENNLSRKMSIEQTERVIKEQLDPIIDRLGGYKSGLIAAPKSQTEPFVKYLKEVRRTLSQTRDQASPYLKDMLTKKQIVTSQMGGIEKAAKVAADGRWLSYGTINTLIGGGILTGGTIGLDQAGIDAPMLLPLLAGLAFGSAVLSSPKLTRHLAKYAARLSRPAQAFAKSPLGKVVPLEVWKGAIAKKGGEQMSFIADWFKSDVGQKKLNEIKEAGEKQVKQGVLSGEDVVYRTSKAGSKGLLGN